ncbi:MAG: hypothetical protein RLZZ417_1284 [Bacteroidota bacterium]|jgi:hypothetical protein
MAKKKHNNILVNLHFFDFEGGFWGMVDEDGNKWLPLNLSDFWMSQGSIKVLVSFTMNENLVSLVNWGTPVVITEITNG